MHITKDGKYMSEADCTAWFERVCECGHTFGEHYPETCHHTKTKGGIDFDCRCPSFKAKNPKEAAAWERK